MSSDLVIMFETHATSLDNEAGIASGWFDVALSPTGEQQARELGARHRDVSLASVFCSDLVRAVRTAEIAFADRGIPIVQDQRLRECDYGTLTSSAASEVEAQRPYYLTTPFPGGESYQQVVDRVAAWLHEVEGRFAGRTVLVVGHRATFYALEHLINRRPLQEVVMAPWKWQPGWIYRLGSGHEFPLSTQKLQPRTRHGSAETQKQ